MTIISQKLNLVNNSISLLKNHIRFHLKGPKIGHFWFCGCYSIPCSTLYSTILWTYWPLFCLERIEFWFFLGSSLFLRLNCDEMGLFFCFKSQCCLTQFCDFFVKCLLQIFENFILVWNVPEFFSSKTFLKFLECICAWLFEIYLSRPILKYFKHLYSIFFYNFI